eukprot:scaffold64620_cov35-Phaeocystis_antarctica.AAC.1
MSPPSRFTLTLALSLVALQKDVAAVQHLRDEEAQLWWEKEAVPGTGFDPLSTDELDPLSVETAHSEAVVAAARAAATVAVMEAAARAAAATLAAAPVLAAARK